MKFTKHKIYLSWDCVDSLCATLADDLMTCPETGLPRDNVHIVGIARGGLIPATILSHLTGFPMTPVYHSNRDADVSGVFPKHLNDMLLHGDTTVVFVDDICDTGKTNLELVDIVADIIDPFVFSEFRSQVAEFMCLVEKDESEFSCDSAGLVMSDDRWIVFPWEV